MASTNRLGSRAIQWKMLLRNCLTGIAAGSPTANTRIVKHSICIGCDDLRSACSSILKQTCTVTMRFCPAVDALLAPSLASVRVTFAFKRNHIAITSRHGYSNANVAVTAMLTGACTDTDQGKPCRQLTATGSEVKLEQLNQARALTASSIQV